MAPSSGLQHLPVTWAGLNPSEHGRRLAQALYGPVATTPTNADTLVDWFYQRDQCLMSNAHDWPACWGGNYRVDVGDYVTEDDWYDVLGESFRDHYLWMLVANYGFGSSCEVIGLDEIVAHIDDIGWLSEECLDPDNIESLCFYTEATPEDLSLEELAELDAERPDLLGDVVDMEDVLRARESLRSWDAPFVEPESPCPPHDRECDAEWPER